MQSKQFLKREEGQEGLKNKGLVTLARLGDVGTTHLVCL